MKKILNLQFFETPENLLWLNKWIISFLIHFLFSFTICHIYACCFHYYEFIDESNIESFISRYELNDSNIFYNYLTILYFSFTTFLTIGYGDLTPYSNFELLFTSVFMFLSAFYVAFALSNLGATFQEISQGKTNIEEENVLLNDFCKKLKIPKNIKMKLLNWSLKRINLNKEENFGNTNLIMKEIPQQLKIDIVNSFYSNAIHSIDFFQQCDLDFTSEVLIYLTPLYLSKNEEVYRIHEFPDYIYFISKGNVSFFDDDDICFSTVYSSDYFGEMEIFDKTHRNSTVKTNDQSFFLKLSKNFIFNEIYNKYQGILDKMIKNYLIRKESLEKVKQLIRNIIEEGKMVFRKNKTFKKIFKLNEHYKNKIYFCIGMILKENHHSQKFSKIVNNEIKFIIPPNISPEINVSSIEIHGECQFTKLIKSIEIQNKEINYNFLEILSKFNVSYDSNSSSLLSDESIEDIDNNNKEIMIDLKKFNLE